MSNDIHLDFSRAHLCGRRQELEELQRAWQRQTPTLVVGDSGAGKTFLADCFTTLSCCATAIIGRGRFEESSVEPFGAVADAVDEVVEQLWSDPSLRRSLADAFGTSAEALAPLLPSILPIMEEIQASNKPEQSPPAMPPRRHFGSRQATLTTAGHFTSSGAKQADLSPTVQLLQNAFRSLLRALTTDHQIVLVLDDLQWADRESLALLEAVLDRPRHNLFFLGLTRSNGTVLTDLKAKLQSNIGLVEILVENLTIDGLTELLATFLHREPEDVGELADICLHKTRGNPFFAVEFLRALEQRRLIVYDLLRMRWSWDANRIRAETDLSDNIVGMVVEKIAALDHRQQVVLMNAAALGLSSFLVRTLHHTMVDMTIQSQGRSEQQRCRETCDDWRPTVTGDPIVESMDELQELLEAAASRDVVEVIAEGKLKFAHDRVREACILLLPTGLERQKLHLEIG